MQAWMHLHLHLKRGSIDMRGLAVPIRVPRGFPCVNPVFKSPLGLYSPVACGEGFLVLGQQTVATGLLPPLFLYPPLSGYEITYHNPNHFRSRSAFRGK